MLPPMSWRDLQRRAGWIAVSLAAATLVVASFVPAFELAIEASIGAGADQEGFRYDRRFSMALDLAPVGVLPVVAAIFAVVAGVFGAIRRPPPWLVVTTFVVAAALVLLVFDTEDKRLQWAGSHGVVGYESDNGGPLLGPGLDDLHAEAEASPEAQRPGWELVGGEHGYASRGLVSWRVFLWSTLALVWLSGYQLARLRLRPVASVVLVAGVSLLVTVWLVLRALTRLQ
jgi:hypothetical protein